MDLVTPRDCNIANIHYKINYFAKSAFLKHIHNTRYMYVYTISEFPGKLIDKQTNRRFILASHARANRIISTLLTKKEIQFHRPSLGDETTE